MNKAEKTRAYIVEKAAPLFNRQGYAATSLQDLTNATGLTKGSIYGNFNNKEEVAVAVYQYQVSLLNERLAAFLQGREKPLDRLIGITDYYRSNWPQIFERGGCPVLNAAVEADDYLTALKQPVQESIVDWAKRIARLIRMGQADGSIRKEVDPDAYGYTIITLLEGGVLMGKIMSQPELLNAALDRIVSIIRQEMATRDIKPITNKKPL